MKTKIKSVLVPVLAASLFLAGCSKVPQAEIDTANAAIETAKMAGADIYLPELFFSLEDSMGAVMIAMESQEAKVIRNYSEVKEGLANVAQYAGEITLQTEQRKEALKEEILTTITEVKSMIETNRQLILEAPRGKEGTSVLVAIKGELNAIETSIQDAGKMLEQGEYLATLEKTRAAKVRAESINAELTTVITTYKSNLRSRVG